jgi:hypothetical protein
MIRAAPCPLLARFDGANGGVRWQRCTVAAASGGSGIRWQRRAVGGFEGSDQTRASVAWDGREEASARLKALSSS